MPLNVIDTLKPKNGLDFPVVEAIDVFVEGYTSLADAVTHFATQTAIDAINTALGTKANTSDVNTATASLQAQIDQIAQTAGTGTADTEIGQARVGADGTSYNNLKTRLDAETNALSDELISLENALYYDKRKTFSLSDKDITPDNEYYFLQFKMQQGKEYTVVASEAIKLWLRADKYTKPSIQSVGDVGTTPISFTAEADLNWCVMYSQIGAGQTFTFEIKSEDGIVVQQGKKITDLESDVGEATDNIDYINNELDQFINPTGSEFAANDFVIGARQSYYVITTSTKRATNKDTTHFSGVSIIPDENVKMFFYSEDGTSSGWVTTSYTLSSELNYCVVLAYQDDRDISDLEDLLSHYEILTPMGGKGVEISDAIDEVNEIKPYFEENEYSYNWVSGNLSVGASPESPGGNLIESTTRISTYNYASIPYNRTVSINVEEGMAVRILFYSTESEQSTIYTSAQRTWHNNTIYSENAPEGANYYRISAKYLSDESIDASAGDNITTDTVPSPVDSVMNNVSRLDVLVSDDFKGKVISILGDSISTFGGSASDDPSERISDGTYTYAGNRCRYPQNNLLTDVNDTYWMRLINTFDMELGINESWAGSRVSWDGVTESADIGANKHIASATRIEHLGENGTPDIIIVNGGTNDIGGDVPIGTFNTDDPSNYTTEQIAALPVATFADAYRTMLIRLQKSYPTSQILVLLPNFTTAYYTPPEADAYCEVIKEACDYFGVKWLDMRASGITMFNRSTYLPDGIHYNAAGMSIIANNARKFMTFNFTIL